MKPVLGRHYVQPAQHFSVHRSKGARHVESSGQLRCFVVPFRGEGTGLTVAKAGDKKYQFGDVIVAPGVVFRVEKVLGKGGMGSAYKVIDKQLGAPCVVKLMNDDAARNPVARARFIREAQTAALLRAHQNLVPVTGLGFLEDGGGDKGTPFYRMPWVEGSSVRQIQAEVAGGKLHLNFALRTTIDTLYGLVRMHERGVIHRDIKPDNILVTKEDGKVIAKVLDLGAAWLLEDPSQPDYVLTPAYAAPEQLADGRLDAKVDVFSTALTLFEMITGKRPYSELGESLAAAIQRRTIPAPLLSEFGEFPEDLTETMMQALSLSPRDRLSPEAFLRKLELVGNALEKDQNIHTVATTPDVLQPRSQHDGPITRADLAEPTEPGPPPEMDEHGNEVQYESQWALGTSPEYVKSTQRSPSRTRAKDTTDPGPPPEFDPLHQLQPRASISFVEAPTGSVPPEYMQPPARRSQPVNNTMPLSSSLVSPPPPGVGPNGRGGVGGRLITPANPLQHTLRMPLSAKPSSRWRAGLNVWRAGMADPKGKARGRWWRALSSRRWWCSWPAY
jgi:serine/threonine protein kinase